MFKKIKINRVLPNSSAISHVVDMRIHILLGMRFHILDSFLVMQIIVLIILNINSGKHKYKLPELYASVSEYNMES